MGYVGPWVRGLRGSKFYVGSVGYMRQNIFYVGQHFTWVIIFTWVAWVKYIFAWVQKFLRGSLCGSFLAIFCVVHNFLRESKKILIGAITKIS